MKFQRIQKIEDALYAGRVLIIYGPRRIGKTTMAKNFLNSNKDKKVRYDVGDDLALRSMFKRQNRAELLQYCLSYEIIVIDEAQMIEDIGIGVKMMIDEYKDKTIILTGSSSFEIMQKVGEPLTGRHFTMTLLPISTNECEGNNLDKKSNLENLLIYGSYPEILSNDDTNIKEKLLGELVSSYLFKDVLSFDKLKSSKLLLDITRCIAFQIGHEVSYNEIANTANCDQKTVKKYLDLLEKTFIIKAVSPYSSNPRSEITQKKKYYFYDLGVRNALIQNLNKLDVRNDFGQLFENFIFMEIFKKNVFTDKLFGIYFWRSKNGEEVDIVIEQNGKLQGYECKWSDNKSKHKFTFLENYPDAQFNVVNKDNFLDFV
jgi:predicted AAA+ superfamily ATPase